MSKSRIIERVKALDLPSLKGLLDAKPTLLHVTDREGRNLLHVACSVPSAKDLPAAAAARVVNFLLDRGLEIDTPVGRDSCTALFFAVAWARNRTLVKLLLKRGAKVTAAPGGGLWVHPGQTVHALVWLLAPERQKGRLYPRRDDAQRF